MYMSTEEESLAAHVEICAIRYKRIEEKFDEVERRITKIEDSVTNLSQDVRKGFEDIRLTIERQNNSRVVQIIASSGAIVVAIAGVIGYWLH